MKAIMALWHLSNKGKTETLRELAGYLEWFHGVTRNNIPYPPSVPTGPDIRCLFNINGITVAIDSQGDPNTNLLARLQDLVTTHKADVIFCATRTRGETVGAVESIQAMGYDLIWTSSYHLCNSGSTAHANRLKAQHMVELMKQLRYLP